MVPIAIVAPASRKTNRPNDGILSNGAMNRGLSTTISIVAQLPPRTILHSIQ